LASSSKGDQTVKVFDSITGAEVAVLRTGEGPRGLAFSPDCLRIASGGDERTVLVFAIPGAKPRALRQGEVNSDGRVNNVQFNSSGDQVAAGAVIWDARTGKEVKRLSGLGPYRRLAWSPKDNFLAGIIVGKLTDPVTGQVKQTLEGGVNRPQGGGWGHAFSPDGQLVAEASNSEIGVWNTSTGQLVHVFKFNGSSRYVDCVTFNPDGRLLAAGCGQPRETPLQVWDLRTGKLVFAADTYVPQVWGVTFSPDGELLAAAGGDYAGTKTKTGAIRLWDTKTWEVVRTMPSHTPCLYAVQFSPNGRRLAASGGLFHSMGKTQPGEVTIWDVDSGQEVWTMPDVKTTLYGVAFSPDGRRLATGSAEGMVQILDGTPLAALPERMETPADN
jgi:WD40 repeat protein